jgi:hypothetical protein
MVTLRLRFVVSDRVDMGMFDITSDVKAIRKRACTAFLDRRSSWTLMPSRWLGRVDEFDQA